MTVTVQEAQAHLPELIEQLQPGQSLVITRNETPVARLIAEGSARRKPRQPGDWQRLFDAYLRDVAARAGRYPEGFVLDDSRETIYEGRGE